VSRQQSLARLNWRNDQYLFYEDFLPFSELSGATVLDYGCGPGDDIVAVLEKSDASKVIGVDVAARSLAETKRRVQTHGASRVELELIDEDAPIIPLPDNSVDFIVSSGVLHHCPNVHEILLELRRVLKPSGRIRVMVYNRESIFVHLYVAYVRQILWRVSPDASLEEAFRRSTDGPGCPYSKFYNVKEFCELAERAGFVARTLGAAASVDELKYLQEYRWQAVGDRRLGQEHRTFLRGLTFDTHGLPRHDGLIGGIDGFYELNLAA
jgi:ubiquinone/menaquinone biosynthesis C-methylase UbiE